MLRRLTPERSKVAEAMIFCIEHAEASDEIIDFITESLNSVSTKIPRKVSYIHVYLAVFVNCCLTFCFSISWADFFWCPMSCTILQLKQSMHPTFDPGKIIECHLWNPSRACYWRLNSSFRFQNRLVEIVKYMHQTFESCESRLKAEAFKQRVMLCFRAWEDWNVYPPEFLCHLQNIFLGLVSVSVNDFKQASFSLFRFFFNRKLMFLLFRLTRRFQKCLLWMIMT